ncbi:hypothetical protein G6F15_009863 [Rhizopus arrhizus]|nr:hypothetical protein G6F15_009863 [Rhizopus arrhizus]
MRNAISTANSNEYEAQDFILSNPHLYQLQTICEQCNNTKEEDEAIVSLIENNVCSNCQGQGKRPSIVNSDLMKDLEYIDQTYYSDMTHYTSTRTEDDVTEERPTEERNWSKLTIGEINPRKKRRNRLIGNPKSMSIDLSYRSLVELSPSIGYLSNLTSLILSNNQMTALPKEVGYLKNLRLLNISDNKIHEIPDTIAFLSNLKALYASRNNLKTLPASIGQLSELTHIIVSENQIAFLPKEMSQLSNLISLYVSYNPLRTLPAEIATLTTLTKLMTEGCDFQEEYIYNLRHDPPSLMETCARIAVRHELEIPYNLADHIKHYLARANKCSYCHGPYFDSHVTRYQFAERLANNTLALEYTLCSAHWSDDQDRVLAMFSDKPETSHSATWKYDLTTEDDLNPSYFNSGKLVGSSIKYFSDFSSSSETIPISRLRNEPNLPTLPIQQGSHASSSASIRKKFTNFIHSSSNSILLKQGNNYSQENYATSSSSIAVNISEPLVKNVDLTSFRSQLKRDLQINASNILTEQQQEQEQTTSITRNSNSIDTVVSK